MKRALVTIIIITAIWDNIINCNIIQPEFKIAIKVLAKIGNISHKSFALISIVVDMLFNIRYL